MSFLNPEIFAIDISDRSFKIVKLKKGREGVLRVASFLSSPIGVGIIEQGEIRDVPALASLIKEGALKVNGEALGTPYVIASLPEGKTLLRVIQVPYVPLASIPSVVIQEAENYIPFPLDEVTISFQLAGKQSLNQDHLDILLVAVPHAIVLGYTEALKKCGFIPVLFEPESFAVVRALIADQKSDTPVLLIDFGMTQTSFIIFSGYSIQFTSSFSLSSSDFTQAICDATHLSFEEAELLKITEGVEEHEGRVYQALKNNLEDFTREVTKQLSFYRSHAFHGHGKDNGNVEIRRILLTGSGSFLKGFDAYLASSLRADVDMGDPWVNVRTGRLQFAPILPFSQSLTYTTAIGLALGAQNFWNS